MVLSQEDDFYLIVIAIFVIVTGVFYKYNKQIVKIIEIVFKRNHILGTFLFILISTVSGLFLAPVTPFNILAIYLYPPVMAFTISMVAHVTSALANFYIARHFEPKIIRDKLDKISFFKLASKKSNLSANEWLELSILTRVSPNFPYAVISYLWGFTKIPVEQFLIGTIIGTIPYLVLEMYVIHGAKRFITGERNYFVVGSIVVTLLISYGIDKFVQHLIDKKEQEEKFI
jgi:uncharacterized membrane protein YdjX (TVP38/TMEM64 family)